MPAQRRCGVLNVMMLRILTKQELSKALTVIADTPCRMDWRHIGTPGEIFSGHPRAGPEQINESCWDQCPGGARACRMLSNSVWAVS
jgi:hypothetical protein